MGINLKLKNSEKKEKNEIELIIEVEPVELDAAINKAYIKNRNRISVPGFRKGKAPRKIIEKMYGVEMFLGDALDNILPDVLRFVLDETDFDIVGYPKVSDVDIKDDNTRAEFTLIAALHPEVTLGTYKGLSAPKPVVEIPDSEIDKEIESTRMRNARVEKADRPAAAGDIAVIDFEGFIDNVPFEGGKGANYELELGSGSFIPGFEEQVEGMEAGQERDIELVFPEDYKEDLAGKPVIFKVKLNEVKEKILPELDDEFAMDVSEFDTLEEYKADLKEGLLKKRQQDVDEAFENLLMEQVIDSMEADVPDAMVAEHLDNSMNNFSRQISSYGMQPEQYMQMIGVTPDIFRERMRMSSEKQVKMNLAMEKIAELECIEVTDEQIEEEYKEASERFSMELDKLKESVTRDVIIRDLKIRNAAKLVVDSAVIEEPSKDTKEKKPAKKNPAKKADKGNAENTKSQDEKELKK